MTLVFEPVEHTSKHVAVFCEPLSPTVIDIIRTACSSRSLEGNLWSTIETVTEYYLNAIKEYGTDVVYQMLPEKYARNDAGIIEVILDKICPPAEEDPESETHASDSECAESVHNFNEDILFSDSLDQTIIDNTSYPNVLDQLFDSNALIPYSPDIHGRHIQPNDIEALREDTNVILYASEIISQTPLTGQHGEPVPHFHDQPAEHNKVEVTIGDKCPFVLPGSRPLTRSGSLNRFSVDSDEDSSEDDEEVSRFSRSVGNHSEIMEKIGLVEDLIKKNHRQIRRITKHLGLSGSKSVDVPPEQSGRYHPYPHSRAPSSNRPRQGCKRYKQEVVTRLVAVWEAAYQEQLLTASDDPFPTTPAPAILGRLADEVGLPIADVRKWWANRNNFNRRKLINRSTTSAPRVATPRPSAGNKPRRQNNVPVQNEGPVTFHVLMAN